MYNTSDKNNPILKNPTGIIRSYTQKENDLNYGLKRERHTADIFEKSINKLLLHSLYEKSVFDFYDKRETFIFEIKNYRYSIHKYAYEIIGVGKLISDNLVLIFRHEDNDDEIYFIQHNKKLFEPFNRRYIGYTLCVDIPKNLLTHLDHNAVYKLKNCRGEREKVKELIKKDHELYDILKEVSVIDIHKKIINNICEINGIN